MIKKCFKCKKRKPLDQFYAHSEMADGHLGKCKTCAKRDVVQRYYSKEGREKVAEYERKRFQDPERKRKVLQYQRKRRQNAPGKDRARNALNNALRDGRVLREPCVVCGNPKSQGHHPDYRRPLFVTWLCFKHHRAAHGQKAILA